jgi:hypothetical protein
MTNGSCAWLWTIWSLGKREAEEEEHNAQAQSVSRAHAVTDPKAARRTSPIRPLADLSPSSTDADAAMRRTVTHHPDNFIGRWSSHADDCVIKKKHCRLCSR